MKKTFLALFLALVFINGFSQKTDTTTKEQDEVERIFTRVEKEARFPGGIEGWRKYLETHLNADLAGKYIPLKKKEKMAQQTVRVQFRVNKEGKVSDVKALYNPEIHPKLRQEAERVIKSGPDWIPAEQNGKKVIYQAIQNITFQVAWQ